MFILASFAGLEREVKRSRRAQPVRRMQMKLFPSRPWFFTWLISISFVSREAHQRKTQKSRSSTRRQVSFHPALVLSCFITLSFIFTSVSASLNKLRDGERWRKRDGVGASGMELSSSRHFLQFMHSETDTVLIHPYLCTFSTCLESQACSWSAATAQALHPELTCISHAFVQDSAIFFVIVHQALNLASPGPCTRIKKPKGKAGE